MKQHITVKAAAFDYLPHVILLAKLDKLGFPCSLAQWLKTYLINRTYSGRLNKVATTYNFTLFTFFP